MNGHSVYGRRNATRQALPSTEARASRAVGPAGAGLLGLEALARRQDLVPEAERRGEDIVELARGLRAREVGAIRQAVGGEPRALELVEDAARPAVPGVHEAARHPERREVLQRVRDLLVGGARHALVLALDRDRPLIDRPVDEH